MTVSPIWLGGILGPPVVDELGDAFNLKVTRR